jgi:hypothetical protein
MHLLFSRPEDSNEQILAAEIRAADPTAVRIAALLLKAAKAALVDLALGARIAAPRLLNRIARQAWRAAEVVAVDDFAL